MMPFAVEQIWHAGRPVRVAEKGSTLALLLEATVRRITAAAASDADVRGAAMKQPNLDRRVRQLIARHKPATLAEILPLCPYQTLLGPLRDIPPDLASNIVPDVVVAVFGFVPEDFSDQMRADIISALRAGEIVRLISNRAELRDYARREIALAFGTPAGSA
jgi:hypothetical protein